MQPTYVILVLNTGSSSTKVALFHDHGVLWKEEIAHPAEQLKVMSHIEQEITYRLDVSTIHVTKAPGRHRADNGYWRYRRNSKADGGRAFIP